MNQITVKKNLMEIFMESAYVMLDILMMSKIIYANNAIIVGKINLY